MLSVRPRLALTLGDCAGIGPELTLRMLSDPGIEDVCRLTVYGSLPLLERVAATAGLRMPTGLAVHPYRHHAPLPVSDSHALLDFPFDEARTLVPGQVQAACGRQAHAWICAAVQDIQAGRADALVTAPINKAAMHEAGVHFPGHTELLAHLTGGAAPCMAFYSDALFVSLATIHEALRDVPGLLTVPSLLHTIRLTATACQEFGERSPRIGVLALNPHAGETGLFGREEREVIAPAMELARAEGIRISGPLVPDTAFTWLTAGKPPPCNGYVAMYHDQGLIPFKMAAFDTGVNVTLGLPVIRTSPDHGTAFDLAWKGEASPASLASAIRLAARMAAGDRGKKRPVRAAG
jgi:4-hydroxythreonine-4-phosphate dehydrogenase